MVVVIVVVGSVEKAANAGVGVLGTSNWGLIMWRDSFMVTQKIRDGVGLQTQAIFTLWPKFFLLWYRCTSGALRKCSQLSCWFDLLTPDGGLLSNNLYSRYSHPSVLEYWFQDHPRIPRARGCSSSFYKMAIEFHPQLVEPANAEPADMEPTDKEGKLYL